MIVSLLGLQNGEDTFSSFISAPANNTNIPETQMKESADLTQSEEESFFNQVAPTEKEKVRLDKDSILALYGNTSTTNFNQYSHISAYPQNPQSSFHTFGGYPQQPSVVPIQNGVAQVQNNQWQQQQWPKQGQYPQQNQMQYVANSTQFSSMQGNHLQGIPQATFPGQVTQQPFPQMSAFSQPNPFFPTQNLQQQFSNLSLTNSNTNTGNVWH